MLGKVKVRNREIETKYSMDIMALEWIGHRVDWNDFMSSGLAMCGVSVCVNLCDVKSENVHLLGDRVHVILILSY